MSTVQEQLEQNYKLVKPEDMILGKKYVLAFSNYRIKGLFTNIYVRNHSKVVYGVINDKAVQISHNGYQVFCVEDIRIKQALRYFGGILPPEIIILIGKKWAVL